MSLPNRAVAHTVIVGCLLATMAGGPALAQTTAAPADPVVAKVDGQPIYLSDVKEAAATMPQSAHSMPPQTLYPMLLDQMIESRALVSEAHRTGLDKDPAVQRQVADAEERALATAVLHKEIASKITDQAIRAKFDADVAGKPAEQEVHARHILVDDEATAKKIINELNKGADFAALSKQYSKEPGASEQGGDLGFFKKDEMVPEFSAVAFSLKPGQISQTPVHTQFGWHVIQVIEVRPAPAPTYEQARDGLRQKMIQDYVQQVIAQAMTEVHVEKFNMDGSPIRATDSAEPPPAKK